VHDTVDLETRGVPSVYVATVEFQDGGEAQARALGLDAAAVFVAHPIQDRTDEELRALADQAISSVVRGIVSDG
jgi:hypothetical protein